MFEEEIDLPDPEKSFVYTLSNGVEIVILVEDDAVDEVLVKSTEDEDTDEYIVVPFLELLTQATNAIEKYKTLNSSN